MNSYTLSQVRSLLTNQSIQNGNFENLLSYYSDDNDETKITGNLNTGINLIVDDPDLLETFHVNTDMYWPQISQKIYNTDTLYWFLQLLNPKLTKGPFDIVKAPNHVQYLPMALSIISNA